MLRCVFSQFHSQRVACFSNKRVISTKLLLNNRHHQETGSKLSSPPNGLSLLLRLAMAAGTVTCLNYCCYDDPRRATQLEAAVPQALEKALEQDDDDDDETTTIVNWSGTHSIEVPNIHYYEPETVPELEQIIAKCHKEGQPVRPVGSALSPNAISFQERGMVSLANLDRILKIDKENMTVTVEAGARVSQVIDALREHGLTLPNLASIAEQQMGGFTQIGAHGTGAAIAPVDHYVTRLKLVTPARGTVELSQEDGEIFHLSKVGLGCLGVVSEVTMKVVPAHNLLEHTFVLTRSEAKEKVRELLKTHKHVRYMWIPYHDAVVVVTNDEEDENSQILVESSNNQREGMNAFKPLRELLIELSKDSKKPLTDDNLNGKGFGELRDSLLAFHPLSGEHVKTVNQAEAEFWKLNQGYQIRPSDELLQFDCGGQQWVFEVCFPTGTYDDNAGHDMQFMETLLNKIESGMIPAHAPIEQRWSAASSSLMSPAYGPDGGLHCWVGIILYLPTDDEQERKEITSAFKGQYCDLAREVGSPFGAVTHWGKLEMPTTGEHFLQLRHLLSSRYPLDKFNAARLYCDPKNILGNDLLNTVLGNPR
mmetsp:Transcript_2582/g.4841  ORF Transcript_2582/g.4841 Transcript_2582/m.4841 type:complete len:594 (-) Transcript_2582:2972-4753(-)